MRERGSARLVAPSSLRGFRKNNNVRQFEKQNNKAVVLKQGHGQWRVLHAYRWFVRLFWRRDAKLIVASASNTFNSRRRAPKENPSSRNCTTKCSLSEKRSLVRRTLSGGGTTSPIWEAQSTHSSQRFPGPSGGDSGQESPSSDHKLYWKLMLRTALLFLCIEHRGFHVRVRSVRRSLTCIH